MTFLNSFLDGFASALGYLVVYLGAMVIMGLVFWRLRRRVFGRAIEGYTQLLRMVMSQGGVPSNVPPPSRPIPCRECDAPLQDFMPFCWHCGAKQLRREQPNVPGGG